MKNLPKFILAAATAAAAIADPAPKPASMVIGPGDFAKDRNVRIQKDTIDDFQYARLSNFDTNAPAEAISWKVKPAQVGKWHILLTIRSGGPPPSLRGRSSPASRPWSNGGWPCIR